MEVRFKHEGVVAGEHAVDEESDENSEGEEEKVLPVVPREDIDSDRDHEQHHQRVLRARHIAHFLLIN